MYVIKVIGLNRSAVMRLCPTRWCDAADDDPKAAFFSLTASIAGQWSSALPLPSFRKGAVDDTASATHDRGHAIKKPFARYATIVSSSNQSIGAIFREIARQVGSLRYPILSTPPDPGKGAGSEFAIGRSLSNPISLQCHAPT